LWSWPALSLKRTTPPADTDGAEITIVPIQRGGDARNLSMPPALGMTVTVYLFGWSQLIPVRIARSPSIEGRQQRLVTDFCDALI
jgi:hypothetical protein